MIRWIKFKLTGDPLTEGERDDLERLEDMYKLDQMLLSDKEFCRYKRLWITDDRYDS